MKEMGIFSPKMEDFSNHRRLHITLFEDWDYPSKLQIYET